MLTCRVSRSRTQLSLNHPVREDYKVPVGSQWFPWTGGGRDYTAWVEEWEGRKRGERRCAWAPPQRFCPHRSSVQNFQSSPRDSNMCLKMRTTVADCFFWGEREHVFMLRGRSPIDREVLKRWLPVITVLCHVFLWVKIKLSLSLPNLPFETNKRHIWPHPSISYWPFFSWLRVPLLTCSPQIWPFSINYSLT